MNLSPQQRRIVLVPDVCAQARNGLGDFLESQGFEPLFLPAMTNEDVNAGYAHVDNDVCVSTVAIIGQLLNYLKANSDIRPISALAPELCLECRAASLHALMRTALSKAGIRHAEVHALSHAEFARIVKEDASQTHKPIRADDKTLGLCGPLPILTINLFSRVVEDAVARDGRQLIKPPLDILLNTRDVIAPAVRYFAEHGIVNAICLLPFGCLSGHVFGRGQLRALRRLHPAVNMSMLDYDPSASEVNLINRVELLVQGISEKDG